MKMTKKLHILGTIMASLTVLYIISIALYIYFTF